LRRWLLRVPPTLSSRWYHLPELDFRSGSQGVNVCKRLFVCAVVHGWC
jgi:hypothetical protein